MRLGRKKAKKDPREVFLISTRADFIPPKKSKNRDPPLVVRTFLVVWQTWFPGPCFGFDELQTTFPKLWTEVYPSRIAPILMILYAFSSSQSDL